MEEEKSPAVNALVERLLAPADSVKASRFLGVQRKTLKHMAASHEALKSANKDVKALHAKLSARLSRDVATVRNVRRDLISVHTRMASVRRKLDKLLPKLAKRTNAPRASAASTGVPGKLSVPEDAMLPEQAADTSTRSQQAAPEATTTSPQQAPDEVMADEQPVAPADAVDAGTEAAAEALDLDEGLTQATPPTT